MGSKVLVGALLASASVLFAAGFWIRAPAPAVALAAPPSATAPPREPVEPAALAAETLAERTPAPPLEPAAEAELAPAEPAVAAPVATPAELALLIEDLRDDTIRFNAERALWTLGQAGPEVVPLLERALRSSDWQQRQLAGWLLARREDHAASQALADVLVEALQEDELPYGTRYEPALGRRVSATTLADNRQTARHALRQEAALFRLAEAALARALYAPEELTRAEAAWLLASHRSELARVAVVDTLLEHLCDNQVEGDATLALRGLYRLGADALPGIENAWPGRDEQQQRLLAHLLARLEPEHAGARRLAPAEFARCGFERGDPLLLEDQGYLH